MTTLYAEPQPVSRAMQRELDKLGPEGQKLQSALEAQNRSMLDELYPKPVWRDIETFWTRKEMEYAPLWESIQAERERRYNLDKTPTKYASRLSRGQDRRFHSRLTHNEINRQKANQLANMPKVKILAASDDEKGRAAAIKETRWCNALVRWVATNRANWFLRNRLVDAQNECGYTGVEIYIRQGTAYDKVKQYADPQMTTGKDGEQRMETPREVNTRLDSMLRQSQFPIGYRFLDGMTFVLERDDDGVCAALIVEDKAYKDVKTDALKAGKDPATLKLPDPGSPGRPTKVFGNNKVPQIGDTVTTYRYYDRRWYSYWVGDDEIETKEHGLPICPVIPMYGMITSSPNLDEAIQGICWGMAEFELSLNDLMTLLIDMRYKYSSPKLVVETPVGGVLMADPTNPRTIDFTKNDIPELNPGQKIVNALDGFQQYMQLPEFQMLLSLWERNGLNPITMGEAPGANAAGFTVNALSTAATTLYGLWLDAEASFWEELVDASRFTVRDTVQERVFLPVMGADRRRNNVEWMGYGPDDVSEVRAIATIDPNNPTSRIAIRQSLMQANKEGYIPRYVVQTEGFGAEDPQEWDDEIVIDMADQAMLEQDIQTAMTMTRPPAPVPTGPVIYGPDGQVISGGGGPGGNANGATPAPPNPPTVGAGANQASQTNPFETRPGPASQSASAATAGQARNYVPRSAQR